VQFVSGFLEDRRARLARRATRLDETRAVLEDAAGAFVAARLALDNALTAPGNTALDSVALYAPLATQESLIALRLGSSHPITRAWSEATRLWADAVNLARVDAQRHGDEIVRLRNEAFDRHATFLDLRTRVPYLAAV